MDLTISASDQHLTVFDRSKGRMSLPAIPDGWEAGKRVVVVRPVL